MVIAQTQERQLPYDHAAESAVLGALLIDGEAYHRTQSIVKADDFHRARHQFIYAAMAAVAGRGGALDQITVAQELARQGQSESVGGIAYLGQLVAQTPTSVNVEHYAFIVADKAGLRRVIDVGHRIAELGFARDSDADGARGEALELLYALRPSIASRSIHISSFLDSELRSDPLGEDPQPAEPDAQPTGYAGLDGLLGGLRRSDLIVLGARPSAGKSALALNICLRAAFDGRTALAFSLEMSGRQVARRMLIAETGIDSQRMLTGLITEDEATAIVDAVGQISGLPIYIDESGHLTAEDIRSRCLRLQAEAGLDLVIVDYLQLIDGAAPGRRRRENRVQEISAISRALKALAGELDVPVLALSQLSREVERRPDPRPVLSDLRDSGSIEQDADIVLLLHREEKQYTESQWAALRPGQPYPKGLAEVNVAKHRNGPTGSCTLVFMERTMQFVDVPALRRDIAA